MNDMNSKDKRFKKIKAYLRQQSSAVSVTEIHDAMTKRIHLDISRKTIERDTLEMVENGELTIERVGPNKFLLNKPFEVDLKLRVDDIKLILQKLDPESELSAVLKKLIN